jgi:hypothetical protein
MTEENLSGILGKKTPSDASEFEREQLRFLLSGDDVAVILAQINPSLAWLPVLWEMGLIQNERQLVAWIERNLASTDAVREVVANLKFFGPDTANLLQMRLNSEAPKLELPPYLVQSWKLIIRHMRATKRDLAHNEWFDLQPDLKRGEHNNAVLERLSDILRPQLQVSRRFRLHSNDNDEPQKPADLMSIDFKVRDHFVGVSEVLASWPKAAEAQADFNLLTHLTNTLEAALADATDVGIENSDYYSASDSDVPSIAEHAQNEYHGGFQVIVRVIAEVWTRLAGKSSSLALVFVERWRGSEFRLFRRIALFAAVNPVVPAEVAANMSISLPLTELFRTSESVEFYRLCRSRWNEFPREKREQILRRIREEFQRGSFQEGPDGERAIDRYQYEFLSQMSAAGLSIEDEDEKLLREIQSRWPQWTPKDAEQAGFHVWHSGGFRSRGGDTSALVNVPDDQLVAEAKKSESQAGFLDDDTWHGLCVAEPDRAFLGLAAIADRGEWPANYWQQLLFSTTAYSNPDTESAVAHRLVEFPEGHFAAVAAAATRWLEAHAKTLPDDLLWPIWDKIAGQVFIEPSEVAHA